MTYIHVPDLSANELQQYRHVLIRRIKRFRNRTSDLDFQIVLDAQRTLSVVDARLEKLNNEKADE